MTNSQNKIVVWMQSSLDGRTQGPNGEFDWPIVGPVLHAHFVETLADAGLFLYGRRVFEMMAGYWPIADELPDSTPMQMAYAKIWKPMPKLVFSRSLEAADWNATVVREVDERVTDTVGAASGDAYLFGGAEVVSEFARRDLVDEYQLFVHPVVLGGGATLFPSLADRQDMTLVDSRTYDGRVVALRYARVR
jgi:dihydrofolate reductase